MTFATRKSETETEPPSALLVMLEGTILGITPVTALRIISPVPLQTVAMLLRARLHEHHRTSLSISDDWAVATSFCWTTVESDEGKACNCNYTKDLQKVAHDASFLLFVKLPLILQHLTLLSICGIFLSLVSYAFKYFAFLAKPCNPSAYEACNC